MKKKWIEGDFPIDCTDDVRGIYWQGRADRIMVFNKTIPFIKKNIYIFLLASNKENATSDIKTPSKYIALDELKGGIDPAGADEQWKTARTTIERILKSFSTEDSSVKTFFVGAAIEKAMSEEIGNWLQNGKLSNAGDLTNKDHVASICNWLAGI